MDATTYPQAFDDLYVAATDKARVGGATHGFYAYPARFSPTFAAAAIRLFSEQGDLICDPYMGGGTTIVEALRNGRRAVGCDLNELAVFVTRVKTTSLARQDQRAVRDWAQRSIDTLSYHHPTPRLNSLAERHVTRNLTIPRARFIKKYLHLAMLSADELPTLAARSFVRCALLKAGQWALNGKKTTTSLKQFRLRVRVVLTQMLEVMEGNSDEGLPIHQWSKCDLIHGSAAQLQRANLSDPTQWVDLVVTSPPYPKIHILYHRWQVDGRRETPAPYWISGTRDGEGASYYNFADRRDQAMDHYFVQSLATLQGVRRIMRPGALIVQMLAFGDPLAHLPRYLDNMKVAGFKEVSIGGCGSARGRIWRDVPNRKWHAAIRGQTHSSREVVLIHRAT